MHLGEKKCVQSFDVETQRNHYLEDIGVYGRIILKWVSKDWFGKM